MNPLTVRPDRLARLRKICLALPDATEKVAWGDPTWRIRDRIFAMQKGNYPGGRPSLWLKGEDGQQAALVDTDPALFFVPPYVGNRGGSVSSSTANASTGKWSLRSSRRATDSSRLVAAAEDGVANVLVPRSAHQSTTRPPSC